MQILNFLRFNISLQVKVMASEAAMTFTADSKADRKSAENTALCIFSAVASWSQNTAFYENQGSQVQKCA